MHDHNPEPSVSIEDLADECLALGRVWQRIDEAIQKDAQADFEEHNRNREWTK